MAKTPYPRTDRELLRRIERSGGRAGYKQLVRELGLGGGRERRLLLEQLARITARGELVKITKELWGLPQAAPEKTARTRPEEAQPVGTLPGERRTAGLRDRLVAGRLDLHRDGYGFVRPNNSTDRADDLFIPPTELNGAMQGDEVLVDEAPRDREGRRSGRIARILTRRNPTVVGIFHYARSRARTRWDQPNDAVLNENFIRPFDERMAAGPGGGAILIPEGAEIVPTPSHSPHRVLGEEAQLQRRRWSVEHDDPERAGQHNWLEGLAVDVEITHFPTPGRPARGRIIEVLGPPEAFGVDVEIIIRKHHLPHVFPANILAEATRAARLSPATLPPEDRDRRHDFRGLPIVTIDGETARDFDDAVLVRPLPNGNSELHVHIADVSAYVLPGTDLDLEARLRATSVYFPDRAVPMLPTQLSSGICSLRPDEDRLVLSCLMEIDPRGEIVGYQVCEGIIRSARRMTYTQVQAILDSATDRATDVDQAVREQFIDLVPEFERMYDLALRLNRKRHRRGSIDFDLPEPVIEFDPQGNMESIVRSERGWAHRLIEEFMLSANECVARWIEDNAIPGIYRIHETPDPKRILDFEETAAGFGHSLGFSSLPVKKLTMKADRRDSRRAAASGHHRKPQAHDIPESIPVTPQMYQRLTAKIAGQPEERILSYLMLRSLKQARYSEKNEGHFALASPCYTHFTSPIRRYPDLIVHRLLRALLHAGAHPHGGPITSSDPQPWGTPERSSTGSSTGHDTGISTRSSSGLQPAVSSDISSGRHPERSAQREVEGPRDSSPLHDRSSHSGHGSSSGSSTRSSSGLQPAVNHPHHKRGFSPGPHTHEPIPESELAAIAAESSQAERRADDAERELMEWKKIRFMQDRIGEEFSAIILSTTKYGFFVELDDLFIEGLVPLASLSESGSDARFFFRDADKVIVSTRGDRAYRMGQRVTVLLDRIDRQQMRLQFALVPETTATPANRRHSGAKLQNPRIPPPPHAAPHPKTTSKPHAKSKPKRQPKSQGKSKPKPPKKKRPRH